MKPRKFRILNRVPSGQLGFRWLLIYDALRHRRTATPGGLLTAESIVEWLCTTYGEVIPEMEIVNALRYLEDHGVVEEVRE